MQRSLSYISKDFIISGNLIKLETPELIWNSFDKRIRTSIRKGERSGVCIRDFDGTSKELDALRAFTPNSDDIPPVFESRHHVFVALSEETGEYLGWIVFAGIPGTPKVFLLCHASTPYGKEKQVPNLLLWHALKRLCGQSYVYADIGGSYRPSLQAYFRKFQQYSYPMVLRSPEIPVDLRITPFDTEAFGRPLGSVEAGKQKLSEAFGTEVYTVFPRAMFAIAACLREYRDQGLLDHESEVLISTTTESPYISSCVTSAIEAVCGWSRQPSEKTRAVFLIHEFGFPNPRSAEWRAFCTQRDIPLIEDMAYAWGSDGIGMWGDVRIYSATKIFPVQFGGFLVGMKIPFERMWFVHGCSDLAKEEEIFASIDAHWQDLRMVRDQRQAVWRRYVDRFLSISSPVLKLQEDISPGAFLLKMKDEEEMKRVSEFVRRFGIEVGNWYHNAAIFLPCHQRMTNRHVDYVSGAIIANFREGCGIPHS